MSELPVEAKPLMDHQQTLIRLLCEMKVDETTAVEVGVASGRTSEVLLREVSHLKLLMVDHWKAPENHPRRDQAWYNSAMETARQRTEFAANRRRLLRLNSVVAADLFWTPREWDRVDLVFIDAHHVYESVLMDCVAWYPRVCKGGILCGHDIDSRKDKEGIWGIRKAVELFSSTIGMPFTVEKNTWIMEK